MKRVIKAVVDNDTLFELKPRFGKSAVVALARLGGKSVGIVANNPLHRGGALDADACRKIVDFLVLCDSFNVPIVLLVDTPGFQIGTEAERSGAPGKIMNFMNAMTLVTVPKLSVILRKSYGRAYVCMGGGRHSDDIAAWPTAEISFMSPEFATTIVHGVKPGDAGLSSTPRRDRAGFRRVGTCFSVRSTGGDTSCRYARLPDPHARRLQAPHDERRRPAFDAHMADELLTLCHRRHKENRNQTSKLCS